MVLDGLHGRVNLDEEVITICNAIGTFRFNHILYRYIVTE